MLTLQSPIDSEMEDVRDFPYLPDEWTRLHSAALALVVAGAQFDGTVLAATLAQYIKRLDRYAGGYKPSTAQTAEEVVETASRYFKDELSQDHKNLFAIRAHIKLVVEIDEEFAYRRFLPAIEEVAFRYGTDSSLNELITSSVFQSWYDIPAKVGARLKYADPRLSEFGLEFDRTVFNTKQASQRNLEVPFATTVKSGSYGGSFLWCAKDHAESINAARALRSFTRDEYLLQVSDHEFVLTSHAIYALAQERVVMLSDVQEYESKGFFSLRAIFKLRNGGELVMKKLHDQPLDSAVRKHMSLRSKD